MEPLRVTADPRIKADAGIVALKYGSLVYNVETAANHYIEENIADSSLRNEWRSDLLGGVLAITGKWADGSALVSVPDYARMNGVGPPHAYPVEEEIDFVTGSTFLSKRGIKREPLVQSKVWDLNTYKT